MQRLSCSHLLCPGERKFSNKPSKDSQTRTLSRLLDYFIFCHHRSRVNMFRKKASRDFSNFDALDGKDLEKECCDFMTIK
jgi:hypothetical protein